MYMRVLIKARSRGVLVFETKFIKSDITAARYMHIYKLVFLL